MSFAEKQARDAAYAASFGAFRLRGSADPAFRAFDDWVYAQVLPAILRTGGFLLNEDTRNVAFASNFHHLPLPQPEFDHTLRLLADVAEGGLAAQAAEKSLDACEGLAAHELSI